MDLAWAHLGDHGALTDCIRRKVGGEEAQLD